jgi:hypothetical protein
MYLVLKEQIVHLLLDLVNYCLFKNKCLLKFEKLAHPVSTRTQWEQQCQSGQCQHCLSSADDAAESSPRELSFGGASDATQIMTQW